MRSGYKATEIGVIPQNWDVRPLGDLLSFKNGFNADKSSYGIGMPFANVFEIINRRTLTAAQVPGRVSAPRALTDQFRVEKGDYLFNRTSETQEELGLSAVYTDDVPMLFGGFVIRGRAKSKRITEPYKPYALCSESVRQQITSRGQGAVRANIGQSDLGSVLVALPPQVEQVVIGSALSEIDASIEELLVLLDKINSLKKATMQALLSGDLRLSGFNIPWETMLFSDLATPRRERQIPHASNFDAWCVELEDIESSSGVLAKRETMAGKASAKAVFRQGDILFGRLRPYLRKYLLAREAGYCSTEIWPFAPKPKAVVSSFLFQIVQTESFIEGASTSFGTHMPRADWQFVGKLEFKIPSDLNEQSAIGGILADIEGDILATQMKRDKLSELKVAMSQELLTGRIRLV